MTTRHTTQLNHGTGGDDLMTESIGSQIIELVKIVNGAEGVDGGDVTTSNPFPVSVQSASLPTNAAIETGGHLQTLAGAVNTIVGSHIVTDINPRSTTKDAFGRLRVSYPQVLGFGQFEYGYNTNFIETATNGSGAVANVLNEASISLTNGGGTSGHYAYAATRAFHRYVPGRSQLIRITGSFGTPTANVRQRAGYFSSRDGLFLEYTGTTLTAKRRTYTGGSASDVDIPRSSWYDKFDGTGPSGINMGFATGTTWLFWIDLEWLGVGRYRFGFASPTTGELLVAYEGAGTNNLAVPYMRTANLPIRYEVENTGAASAVTMKWICYAVDTEGGDEGDIPLQYAADNGATAISLNNASTGGAYKPIIALRANTTGPNSVPNRGQIIVKALTLLAAGSNPINYRVVVNPATLTAGGLAPTWTNAGNLASYSVNADAFTGGTVVDAGYVASSATTKFTGDAQLWRKLPLVYTELGSVQDTIVLVAAGVGGTSSALSCANWQEQF